ncbi:MAG: hypothetical protein Kow0068_21320 [Marinilabiliales bacterium]
MKISGFTMVKNADKLYYPIKQSIMSILPIVDEFIVALGDCDPDDKTREQIESIPGNKVKIIDTIWDIKKYPDGTENAHQTDIAKSHCTGDWCFYLQADEVVHEQYLDIITQNCEANLKNTKVEGFIFTYKHFWGDYNHYHWSHNWYKHEIRIIRNDKDIHSWESAQSFRRIPGFDGINYRQQEGTYKLKVKDSGAYIFHYGWVRPPKLMMEKYKALDTIHKGAERVKELEKQGKYIFDYGPLNRLKEFKGTHPEIMQEWIKKFDWQHQLQYNGKVNKNRRKNPHEKFKYRFVTLIENNLLSGKSIGDFKNYILLKD